MGFNHVDMPFCRNGLTPGLILSPHSMPSRMTIGQLIEGIAAKNAAIEGYFGDATIFSKVDLEAIGDRLEKNGYDRHGTETVINGMTGEPIDIVTYIAPCFYQRLQKFAVEEVYSISTGPTCILTHQPLEGGLICLSSLVITGWFLQIAY